MSDFRDTLNLFGPIGASILSVLVAYLIPALLFVVICLTFGLCVFKKRGCWQTFMAAGFAALGVAYLYYIGNCDEECVYMMALAMLSFSFSLILSVRKHG